jgi:orotate phosphoribosyltransferase
MQKQTHNWNATFRIRATIQVKTFHARNFVQAIVPVVNSAILRTLDLFEKTGAYMKGHFRLTSGLHSPGYLQSALVLQYPEYAELIGRQLGDLLRQIAKERIDLVVSPALGGLIIGHEVARSIGVRFLFTERDADRKMSLRRGFVIAPDEQVVVVEDVITTGGSTKEVIDIVSAAGAKTIAAGSIIDRSGGAVDLGVPRAAAETLSIPTYDPANCPLCQDGVPVVKPGSRPV